MERLCGGRYRAEREKPQDSMKREKEGERKRGLVVPDSQPSPDFQSPPPSPHGSEPSDHSSPAEALDDCSPSWHHKEQKNQPAEPVEIMRGNKMVVVLNH